MDVTIRHPALPAGHRLRHPTRDDVEAVATLRHAAEVALLGDSQTTADLVREEWAALKLDLGEDAWVVEDEHHAPAGYGACGTEAPGEIVAVLSVHPDARGRGLSDLLLDLGEARAAELSQAGPCRQEGALGVWTHERDEARVRLFQRRGFTRLRAFVRMDRDLGPAVEDPVWPAGIRVAPFRPGRDEAPVHAAGEEAFRDHFRPVEMSLEEWIDFRFSRGDLDPDLWSVAWDGDAVAGSLLAFETPLGGYLDELFVRRPWRGRGLGRALLLHVCAELRRRGQPAAYFGADSENPTGAMHLYTSAGFRCLHGATLYFEKPLAARSTRRRSV